MEKLVFKNTEWIPATNSFIVSNKFGLKHDVLRKVIFAMLTKARNSSYKEYLELAPSFKIMLRKKPLKNGGIGKSDEQCFEIDQKGFLLLIAEFNNPDILNTKSDFINQFNSMETIIQPNAASVQIFSNSQFGEIRTTGTSDEPLFCLTDVCKILGLQPAAVNRRLSDEVISNHPIIDGLGRNQQAMFVTEDGLYDVILDSRKAEAKAFRKWVTGEVLPAIRKTGGYIQSQPNETPEMLMARALHVANQTIEANQQRVQMLQGTVEIQEQEIKTLAPKATYTDEVLQSTATYTLTQVAHDLDMRSVFELTGWLQRKGILYRQSGQWQPTAKVSGKHYFATRTAKYIKDGVVCSSLSTVVTELGRAYLHSLLKNERKSA